MKQTVNFYDFQKAFEPFIDFSYEALKALFDYFEDYEDCTGEELELDPIGIRCDFSEYENLQDFNDQYDSKYKSIQDIDGFVIQIPETKRFVVNE